MRSAIIAAVRRRFRRAIPRSCPSFFRERIAKERDEARAKLSEFTRELPDQLAEARRTGEFEAQERIALESLERERKRRLQRRVAVRRGICYVLMVLVVSFVGFARETEPGFQTGLRFGLLIAWTAIALWALAAFARHGRVVGFLTKLAEIVGVIGFIVMTWQIFAPDAPTGSTAVREGPLASPVTKQQSAKP